MRRVLFSAVVASAFATSCAKVHDYGGGVVPTVSPSASASASPAACTQTPDVTDTGVTYVAIDSDMSPALDASGASIFGYASYPGFSSGSAAPQTSGVVTVPISGLVQFINTEPSPSTLSHSAVGFTTSNFPPTPYAFPANADSPIGTLITRAANGAGAPWSTGQIEPSSENTNGTACASQVFTASSAGTFYFGDYATYNSAASMRGEIVVTQ